MKKSETSPPPLYNLWTVRQVTVETEKVSRRNEAILQALESTRHFVSITARAE